MEDTRSVHLTSQSPPESSANANESHPVSIAAREDEFASSPGKKSVMKRPLLKRQTVEISRVDLDRKTQNETVHDKVPALKRNATVLFDASWTKKSGTNMSKRRLQRQMSKPTTTVSLSWLNISAVASGARPSVWERIQGIDAAHPNKFILNNG